ncbi:hypothetical protein [Streptomyces macrosporus]|uniref:Uncharacterized protein n=1 Tax=Streptomyces macrosporus TaxID=44032 RepID=A0ABN3KGY3_9ACTN
MPSEGVVTPDRDGYLDIRFRSAVPLDLEARFLDQVFRERAGDASFCEFDAVLAPEIRPALCTMARWHGDDHIDLRCSSRTATPWGRSRSRRMSSR